MTSQQEQPTNMASKQEQPATLTSQQEQPANMVPRQERPTNMTPQQEQFTPVTLLEELRANSVPCTNTEDLSNAPFAFGRLPHDQEREAAAAPPRRETSRFSGLRQQNPSIINQVLLPQPDFFLAPSDDEEVSSVVLEQENGLGRLQLADFALVSLRIHLHIVFECPPASFSHHDIHEPLEPAIQGTYSAYHHSPHFFVPGSAPQHEDIPSTHSEVDYVTQTPFFSPFVHGVHGPGVPISAGELELINDWAEYDPPGSYWPTEREKAMAAQEEARAEADEVLGLVSAIHDCINSEHLNL
ncbi:hypothetical protein CCM_08583 [Cordyceps militaris CM01]|uniref:Uncharacterized protein n=1 Tax=Cordyceps militaris (strain CM01) TaxID=983644 RepID=G3JRU5_CORMM|nr:uncharacterized protein CCM_08583 [Cordyceps militaris CM01]EGX88538.1 hypothetical protein CCM_08583 [Cordyceps militaris CM01]